MFPNQVGFVVMKMGGIELSTSFRFFVSAGHSEFRV